MRLAAISIVAPMCQKTAASAQIVREKGFDYMLRVEDKWAGYPTKLWYAQEMARKLVDYTHILFLDARDIVVLGTPEQVFECFETFCHPWVCGAECNRWPPNIAEIEDYPRSPTPWRFLNSGAYLAEREYLLEHLDRWLYEYPPEWGICDQGWMTRRYIEEPGAILLDHECRLFQTMFGSWQHCETSYGKLHNTLVDTYPLVIHHNGGADIRDEQIGRLWKR
jgi:hypothetical protein